MRWVLCLLALLPCVPRGAPVTYTVMPDGSGDRTTIQAAVDAAGPGDTIELGDGTFTGAGNRDIDTGGTAIHIRSQSGNRSACIIDCQGSQTEPHRAFIFDSGEGSGTILEDLTITGGAAWRVGSGALPADARGGGIYCSASAPVIRDCLLTANSAEFDGGAIYCGDGAAPSLEDCALTLNHASTGGAMSCRTGSASLTDCSFTGNTARSGGGLAWVEAAVTLSGCSFDDNTADVAGGAISAGNASASVISRCTFTGNGAGYGGAVTCLSGGTPAFSECAFSGNEASGLGDWPAGCGAGLFSDVYCSPALTACEFHDNQASADGGGIYTNGTQTHVSDCTFVENSAGGSGGGLYCDSDFPHVAGSLFKYNTAAASGGGTFLRGGFPEVNGSTWFANQAADGGGVALEAGTSTITACTLQGNSAARGGGLAALGAAMVTLTGVLVASSTSGEAVACEGCTGIALACCDLHGNAGGDWEGTDVADQLGADGNIGASPHFCYAFPHLYDDWSIHENSACSAAQSACGLIGAWPADCSDTPVQTVRWGMIKALFRR